ncbi:MAG: hypothetical protein HY060_07735 [Proteobacteria bacterium]|nr:hypothetical protein [Pseudomonadota bacterium]
MPLPDLVQGLVVRYEYVWHRRHEAGADTADKERPVCVTVALRKADDRALVVLLPITHSPPAIDQIGVEIPQRVKLHLGLDANRSWVIVSECNIDGWPSPDLRQLPGQPGRFHYGQLPPRLFRTIRDAFVDNYRARRVSVVTRRP